MKILYYILLFNLLPLEMYSQSAFPLLPLIINKIGFKGRTISDTASYSKFISINGERVLGTSPSTYFPHDSEIGFLCILQGLGYVKEGTRIPLYYSFDLIDKSDIQNFMKLNIEGVFLYGGITYQLDSIPFIPGEFNIVYPCDFLIRKKYMPLSNDTLYNLTVENWNTFKVKK